MENCRYFLLESVTKLILVFKNINRYMYESVATLIFRNQKVAYDGFNNDTFFPETGSFCQVTALTVMRKYN